ncbi:enoyl-CoA hydratase/isomerase family protein [Phenylobacterium sp.]|uniref:enoyl-CoA hydratase/isomerase family protein n=1 Tax=Phenylobacterium sp. TaxID=1871053 RepID=UPI00286C393D|nr:enoyl-CoA hydratase/isomerase family protein [Phenylobacterium sp.]
MDPFEQAWSHLSVRRDGAVAVVTLNRPQARNALNTALMEDLTAFARAIRRRSDITVVILTGGEHFFSAGADLAAQGERRKPTLLETRQAVMAGPDMCEAWEEIEAVTIAALEGYCIGGGCALAVACDFRIMGESASMRLPEVPLGINMSWRSLPRIAALVGPARAKRFVMFGEAATAATCLDWGFCDEMVTDGQALAAAQAWAAKLAALPPLPVRMTKEAIDAVTKAGHHAATFMDRDQYLLTSRTSDFQEGVTAFFEKRPPKFTGD